MLSNNFNSSKRLTYENLTDTLAGIVLTSILKPSKIDITLKVL